MTVSSHAVRLPPFARLLALGFCSACQNPSTSTAVALAPAVAAPPSSGPPTRAGAFAKDAMSPPTAPAVDLNPDLVTRTFARDPVATKIALDLYGATGTVADVLPGQRFDGGYRGIIQLVPALPVGDERKHLSWVAAALRDFDDFFGAIQQVAPSRYRWRKLTVLFFRSVGRTTPNAFAQGWTVAYNVHGSIDTSADAARETLFHEIFHLNDADHGDWSPQRLTAIQSAIERRCGTKTACLAPYAPTQTVVRNGTYYAFQPGNDVHEYAAELALRWYREQRSVIRHEPPKRAFKCGPEENGRAWASLVEEFFGGVDLVSPCR